ncbi:hypothetical protein SeH_A1589 [Salmonella enterica subsp. enterica serovar Hadar str. RI_05P066]|uniref:Uncharacterized protein n=3 Tax=Enterobacterales TaxID=91347 RepID=A0A075MD36_ECOLX|nr:hypothetical protein SeHA_C1574 [Salmonella enterica subsp. enterica serovar Heidelberg str. SL476]AIF78429.1 hypothetical protein [Escherichia coli]AIG56589.1 hypothetical protein [Proteus mirabilis]EDZ37606.1 hypothetical protein SeH_A1589 [Salmonella enterica subsp. enterica serovar Hadar str. RI_05P066]AIG56671.1 hypothetical protein [Proteus mirabilis]
MFIADKTISHKKTCCSNLKTVRTEKFIFSDEGVDKRSASDFQDNHPYG